MKKYSLKFDIPKSKSRKSAYGESIWIAETIEAENIEDALKQAKELAMKRNWILDGVEEQ